MEKLCGCCKKLFKTYKIKQKYCSNSCGQCNKKQNKIIKNCEYTGCTNTFEVLLNVEKKRKTCSINCKNLRQKYINCGENNGNYGKENKWGQHDKEVRLLISKKIKESWKKEERIIKHNEARKRFKLINGYLPTSSPLSREKISEKSAVRCTNTDHLTTYKKCKTGFYYNKKNRIKEFFHSSWEEKLMNELDNDINVTNWTKKHKIIIKYKHNGILKSYIPDFFIEYMDGNKVIEEVKGYIDNISVFKLKKKAAEKYCLENGFKYKINFMKNYERYKHLLND